MVRSRQGPGSGMVNRRKAWPLPTGSFILGQSQASEHSRIWHTHALKWGVPNVRARGRRPVILPRKASSRVAWGLPGAGGMCG